MTIDTITQLEQAFSDYGLKVHKTTDNIGDRYIFIADWLPNKHVDIVLPVNTPARDILPMLRERIASMLAKELPLIEHLHKSYQKAIEAYKLHHASEMAAIKKRLSQLEVRCSLLWVSEFGEL